MGKTKQDVLNHNDQVRDKIKDLYHQQNEIHREIKNLVDSLIPPCEWCNYKGEGRCGTCEDFNYVGFNRNILN
jgi:hypothetical protein